MGTAKRNFILRLGDTFRQNLLWLDGVGRPVDTSELMLVMHVREKPESTVLLAQMTEATHRIRSGVWMSPQQLGYYELHFPSDYTTALLAGGENSLFGTYDMPGIGELKNAHYHIEAWFMGRSPEIAPIGGTTLDVDIGGWDVGQSWMKQGRIEAVSGSPFTDLIGEFSYILITGSANGNDGYYLIDANGGSFLTIRHGLRGTDETANENIRIFQVAPAYDTVRRILEGRVRFSREVIHDPRAGEWDPS